MRLRPLVFAAAMGLIATSATAQINNSSTGGTVTINPDQATSGNNYQSLGDFVAAFNGLAASPTYAINAHWVVEFTNDTTPPNAFTITQATNVFMGNSVDPANGSVTFKPAAGKTVTLNFTNMTDNAGFSGQWLIGATAAASLDAGFVKTDNITIDGSNNGTSSRDLIIHNNGGVPGGLAGNASTRPLTFAGDGTNWTIKNCAIRNYTNIAGNAANVALNITGRQSATVNPHLYPGDITIENNELRVAAAVSGTGLNITISGTAVQNGRTMGQINIIGNEVYGGERGIFVDTVANAIIDGNIVELECPTTARPLLGINQQRSFSGTGVGFVAGTFRVSNNVVRKMQSTADVSGNQSHIGISIGPVNTAGTCTYYIYNNQVGGWNIPNQTAGTGGVRGISINPLAGSSALVAHNSVDMGPSLTAAALTSAQRGGIVFPTSNYPVVMRNNIVRQTQANAPAIKVRPISSANLTSSDNVYFHTNPNTGVSLVFGSNAAGNADQFFETLAGYVAVHTTKEAGSQEIDPTGTGKAGTITVGGVTGGTWTSTAIPANLKFTAKPTNLIGADVITSPVSIATDFEGDTRAVGAGEAYPGFDEIVGQPLPVAVSGFNIE